jgi:phosphatidylglycerol:prolipoprotein diacylglycerol transferase
VFPILIDFGTHRLPFFGEVHLFLPTYGFLFATAVLLAWVWFTRRARTLGVSDEHSFNMCFYSVVAGIVGAKLLLVLLDWRTFVEHPGEIWSTLRLGGVLLGGVICGALTFTLYVRRHGLPFFRLADAVAAPLALAQSMGRLGCFSAGCCWGVEAETGSAFAVTFTSQAAHQQTGVPLDVALVPIQLVQMVHDLLLTLFLTFLWRRNPRPAGTVFWCYMLLYSLGRAIIELWRGDAARGIYFDGLVSTSQLLSAAGIVFALAMLVRGARIRRRSP